MPWSLRSIYRPAALADRTVTVTVQSELSSTPCRSCGPRRRPGGGLPESHSGAAAGGAGAGSRDSDTGVTGNRWRHPGRVQLEHGHRLVGCHDSGSEGVTQAGTAVTVIMNLNNDATQAAACQSLAAAARASGPAMCTCVSLRLSESRSESRSLPVIPSRRLSLPVMNARRSSSVIKNSRADAAARAAARPATARASLRPGLSRRS
jgi:hypothetical protein